VATLWRNWTGDQRCAPAVLEEPANQAEVVAAVERAVQAGERLRVAGAGHSFSDIVLSDSRLMSLARMNRVLDVDPSGGRVEVEPGITLHDLGEQLAAHGLCLENLGDVDVQTVGGAIATGTHGTGARLPNLSAQVVALRLVVADGSVVEVAEDSDREAYRAARVSLGSLGVVVSVTLRCVPLFTLHRVDEPRPLEETLEGLEASFTANEHFEFFAFPYATVALTRSSNRVEGPPRPGRAWRRYLDEVVIENRLFEVACRLGRRLPRAIPWINARSGDIAGRSRRLDQAHRVFATRRLVRFTEMEYAIPREHGAEAVRRVMALVERRRLPVSFPIEVRCVAADDAHLSPSHGRDSCCISVHMYRGAEFESYFRATEAIMDDYDGRPHWGKRHYQAAASLAPRYPRWDDFQRVRAQFDPNGLYGNAYTDRVLQRNVRPSPR
jgi:L-gulonolactone oxidase